MKKTAHKIPHFGSGFTLIELIVAMAVLITLVLGLIISFNPLRQINKGQDATRVSDLQSIKTALDLYYHDTKCYPTSSQGIPFGSPWSTGSTVYMKEVPQDPKFSEGTTYQYLTEVGNPCPQWNVVFAKLSQDSPQTSTCAISSLSNCAPAGYATAKWACTMNGAVNCSSLASSSFIVGTSENITPPTASPTPPTTGTTISPTPIPGSVTYQTLDDTNGPDAHEVIITPLYPTGLAQSIQVKADTVDATIESVAVILYSDGDAREFVLSRSAGTSEDGVWSGSWQVTDTYGQIPEMKYGYDITVTDSLGRTDVDYLRIDN